MTFDEKFPNAVPIDDEFVTNHAIIIKGNNLEKCWRCGERTSWIDLNFETYLCSEECSKKKWGEYHCAMCRNIKGDEVCKSCIFYNGVVA